MQKDRVVVQGEQDAKTGTVNRKCPCCEVVKPLNDFGLRRMKHAGPNGEDVIRNQSWCRECRSSGRRAMLVAWDAA
jgi:hypothetical protein